MSLNRAMKIQIAMNQKKKTIMDAKRSLNVIACALPRHWHERGPAGRDGRSRDGGARVAAFQV
jgi:hypothetical protein